MEVDVVKGFENCIEDKLPDGRKWLKQISVLNDMSHLREKGR